MGVAAAAAPTTSGVLSVEPSSATRHFPMGMRLAREDVTNEVTVVVGGQVDAHLRPVDAFDSAAHANVRLGWPCRKFRKR
jgi:hypothetical protein